MSSQSAPTHRTGPIYESSSSRRRPSNATVTSHTSQESGRNALATLTPARKVSLRNKKMLTASLAHQQANRGISSADLATLSESGAFDSSGGSGQKQPLVSSIPMRATSRSPTSNLNASQGYQTGSRGSSGETATGQSLMEDARAYLTFAETAHYQVGPQSLSLLVRHCLLAVVPGLPPSSPLRPLHPACSRAIAGNLLRDSSSLLLCFFPSFLLHACLTVAH